VSIFFFINTEPFTKKLTLVSPINRHVHFATYVWEYERRKEGRREKIVWRKGPLFVLFINTFEVAQIIA